MHLTTRPASSWSMIPGLKKFISVPEMLLQVRSSDAGPSGSVYAPVPFIWSSHLSPCPSFIFSDVGINPDDDDQLPAVFSLQSSTWPRLGLLGTRKNREVAGVRGVRSLLFLSRSFQQAWLILDGQLQFSK